MARALRSSALTVFGFGTSQVFRLASNLILTRLLFPEAFGMMALVMVFLQGLAMFSDVGVGPAIMQSKRGDEPAFLNTAWTIQVFRGFALWCVAALAAYPLSIFYGEPELLKLLPVAALTLIIAGFTPTKLESAHRHMRLGRLTMIDFATQLTGIVSAVAFAWMLQSVWALVYSGIVSALIQYVLYNLFLTGDRNKFQWESSAGKELINFGKWIFLSTVAGFAISQSDKVILGRYLPLEEFGVYNIGFFLASFPLLLGNMITGKILIPIYRECPPKESPENFAKLRKMRFVVSAGLLVLVTLFASLGVWMADIMYDARYALAGPIVVVIACMQIPQIIIVTYDQAALAAGDSRRFFVLAATKAALIIIGLLIGLHLYGLIGALLSIGVSMTLVYPVVVWLARHTGAWDGLHDLVFGVLGLAAAGCALWLNQDAIRMLIDQSIH